MENNYIKKLEDWADKNLIGEENNWFKRYHFSRGKKFSFSEYFLNKIINFDENDQRYRLSPQEGNFYLNKGKIAADLNLFFECFFFEIRSSLDALAHELNILFKLYPGKKKKYDFIYFSWLYTKDELKSKAPQTCSLIENFSKTDLFIELNYYRKIAAHLTVIIKELDFTTDTLPYTTEDTLPYTTEYLKEPLYIPKDINKELLEENKRELNSCVKEIYEEVKNFYNNIYKEINVDLNL